MEMLERLDSLLSPALFLTLAGLSLTAAALLYVASIRRHDEHKTDYTKFTRLSELLPRESRGAGYLLVAFGWFMLSFLSFSFFRWIGAGSFTCLGMEIADKVFTLLFLFLGLCFLWAGAGDLLRAVTSSRGGVFQSLAKRLYLSWLWKIFYIVVERLVVQGFGDWLTRGLSEGNSLKQRRHRDGN